MSHAEVPVPVPVLAENSGFQLDGLPQVVFEEDNFVIKIACHTGSDKGNKSKCQTL
jgi:hypothetical protein